MAKSKQLALMDSAPVQKFVNSYFPVLKKNTDLFLAIGIIFILLLLIIPLPTFLLDFFLATNLTLSILILMVAVYLRTPLEFSSFPTILLISTIFRLGLNVASTRLILSEAHAGQIIEAFGKYVIGGNYVVGIIIFLILLVINFIVVIKGSTRIAEVTARFTLDALPGKQMSIDADLNAGYIDEQTARKRRSELNQEADFFGAMDGASKFIRGDAIAGLIITAINIIGGFLIGILQLGMQFQDAAATFTILTIGDGLISQIPALLISISGGLVVTRSASGDQLEIELGNQFGSKPKPLFITAGMMFLIGLLPGFPLFPFILLGTSLIAFGYFRSKNIAREADDVLSAELAKSEQTQIKEEQPVEELLKVDPVEIELGYSLISLVDESQGGDVFKRITNVRRQLAIELGIILPPVRVRDNLQLEPEEYVIKIRGNEITRNVLYPNMLLAMNPGIADGEITGIKVVEPVFALPATWVSINERENAEILGYTVVEAATVLTTHLTELLKRNADKLITRQDVKQLIDNLKDDYPALIDEMSPENLQISTVQKVLQNLLGEGIPVKDLPMIIESLLEYGKVTKNIDVLTEYTRHSMSESIKKLFQDSTGVVHAIALDPHIEDIMTNALQASNQNAMIPSLGLPPDMVRNIQESLSDSIEEISMAGFQPVVICSAQIRPYFYRMIHATYPMISVISYTELPAETDIEIHGSIRV